MKDFQYSYDIHLKYGLRGENIVDILDLSVNERGLNCNCICPNCKSTLVAKLGNKNRWHFAHKSAECDINIANQTALHILAKDIIKNHKQFRFPALKVELQETNCLDLLDEYIYYIDEDEDEYDIDEDVPSSIEYRKSKKVKCDDVILEKKLSNIIPDIKILTQNKECLIEIAVTHFVDDEKIEKIKKIGLPVIEIDLSEFKSDELSYIKLKNIIIDGLKYKKWVYNPLKQQAIEWANAEYEKIYEKLKAEEIKRTEERKAIYEAELRKRQAEEEIKRRKMQIKQEKLSNLIIQENYTKELNNLRNDNEFIKFYKTTRISKTTKNLPLYMDIPIFGETIFMCDRRIWQCALFEKFVFYRKDNATINVKKIEKWATDHQKIFKIDWSLMGKTFINRENIDLFHNCINTYLSYLTLLGFIDNSYKNEKNIIKINTITPPDEIKKDILFKSLEVIDKYSVNIDKDIKRFIENPILEAEKLKTAKEAEKQHKKYKNSIIKLQNDDEFIKFYKTTHIGKANENLPFYMDIPIFGEMIFMCDRRIWQCALFEKFIFCRKDNSTINIKNIEKWVTSHQNIFKIDQSLMGYTVIDCENINFLHNCISTYISYLALLGFVENSYKIEKSILKTNSLTPPNDIKKDFLLKSLKVVDIYSINIDKDIESHIEKLDQLTIEEKRQKVLKEKEEFQNKCQAEYITKIIKEISPQFDDPNINIIRIHDTRWLKCTECNQILMDSEMASYQYKSGICRDCSRKTK